MAIKKILILYDPMKYNKEQILDDMMEEDFPHYFKFYTDSDFVMNQDEYIENSDEVWCFGEVEHMIIYRVCEDSGCDIWKMG